MVFSSSVFLFAFMPLFFVGYFLMPKRAAKNVWLLLASLFFYAWGEPVYVALMVTSIIVNWLLGIAIGEQDATFPNEGNPEMEDGSKPAETSLAPSISGKQVRRKTLLVAAIVFNVAVIGFFKYEGFLAENVNALFNTTVIPDLDLPLPIGISFYTLQALSYVIDVYRGEVAPQRNPLYLGMYIACFPQLIAGPIVRYQTIQDQILNRRETLDDFSSGLRLFIVGLAKKALLANTVAILANKMLAMGGPEIGAVGAWAGLIAYTFQIFFDFSGYSDMAIGLGRMMGFKYLRNFNYPYISQSITEFWRRWHISLSTFFRDYVYIPLGGSRCSRARWAFNIAIVWAITGLWHGAAWNYVGWGVYYGALLICEKLVWGNALAKAPRPLRHLYAIVIFVFGWSFFWITDPAQLVAYWKAMVGAFGPTGSSTFWELTAWEYWPVFIICIVASTPVASWAKLRITAWIEGRDGGKFSENGIANPRHIQADNLCTFDAIPCSPKRRNVYVILHIFYDAALIVLLLASCAAVVSGSFNPFIYFQF